jgi:hypothetical protein
MDAGEWIFTDEAHLWMDHERDLLRSFQTALFSGSYPEQREGEDRPMYDPEDYRPGWEHGLFGFKPVPYSMFWRKPMISCQHDRSGEQDVFL